MTNPTSMTHETWLVVREYEHPLFGTMHKWAYECACEHSEENFNSKDSALEYASYHTSNALEGFN